MELDIQVGVKLVKETCLMRANADPHPLKGSPLVLIESNVNIT